MASSGSKVSLGCWQISQSIGRELEQKLQLLYVFNSGKSAILSTVDNDVYSVGLNLSGALGTGASQQCIFNPTKIQEVTGRLMYMYSSPVKCTSHLIVVHRLYSTKTRREVWLVFQSHTSRNVWRLHSSMSSLRYGVLERRRVPKNAALTSAECTNLASCLNVGKEEKKLTMQV